MTIDSQQHSPTRDNNLDIYRGCSMIYITCILHNLYGVQHVESVWASLLLITMPIVFYIAGASYSMASSKPYPVYLWRRTKRIVFPYYIMVTLTTIFYFMYRCVIGGDDMRGFLQQFVEQGYYNIFSGNLYDCNHLWFIPTYLTIALLLPLFHFIKKHLTPIVIYTLCIAGCIILAVYPNDIVCYGTFAFAGLYYKKEFPVNRYILAAIYAAAMIVCACSGYAFDMQANKFPPNTMFYAYSGLVLSLFMPLIAHLCRYIYKWSFMKYYIDLYARLGLTVYLYHYINVLIIGHLLANACQGFDLSAAMHIVILCATSVVLFFANAYLSIVMKKIESVIIDFGSGICSAVKEKLSPQN